MRAKRIFHEKVTYPDDSVMEVKVWQVTDVFRYPLGVKYSLYYVKDGKIIVGYDNHYPKGPHCHYEDKEVAYHFKKLDKLVSDFQSDCKKRGGLYDSGQKNKN